MRRSASASLSSALDRATRSSTSPGSTIRAPNLPVNAVTSAGTVNVTSADSPGSSSTRA